MGDLDPDEGEDEPVGGEREGDRITQEQEYDE